MPEKGVVKLNEREVRWEERQVPKKISRDDDQAFYGVHVLPFQTCTPLNMQLQDDSSLTQNAVHGSLASGRHSLYMFLPLRTRTS